LRKRWHCFGAKGFQNNELTTSKMFFKIAKLRFDRAQLLGYATHAHFVLEEEWLRSGESKTFSMI
jgi:peptidyl-dipeptidase Dcp